MQQQLQCSRLMKTILIECSKPEILMELNPTTLNNLLEKDLMKNYKNLVTSTSGSTLNLTKKQRATLIGSIILQGGILILIFSLFARLIIQKQMKERILKIFGSLFLFTLLIGCVKEQNCTVTKIYSGDESIKNISNTDSLTITVIEKEYVVLLECY